ncbi:hypothetical protein M011DRAFT_78708 [Sporormia fimetaria CBS 119925]|uniref:Uncharacterized protein n=1 Tax=Sporormia fimetaria CBS 119925 TaxID=1340428 RepID=A0A6A6V7Z3_9PLEO|nr:hypothetical protein M011DRAFT_78708 [Sporormia fimetaria CBS 119925]
MPSQNDCASALFPPPPSTRRPSTDDSLFNVDNGIWRITTLPRRRKDYMSCRGQPGASKSRESCVCVQRAPDKEQAQQRTPTPISGYPLAPPHPSTRHAVSAPACTRETVICLVRLSPQPSDSVPLLTRSLCMSQPAAHLSALHIRHNSSPGPLSVDRRCEPHLNHDELAQLASQLSPRTRSPIGISKKRHVL